MRKFTLARPSKHALARLLRRWAKKATPEQRRRRTLEEEAWSKRKRELLMSSEAMQLASDQERKRVYVKHERRVMRSRLKRYRKMR